MSTAEKVLVCINLAGVLIAVCAVFGHVLRLHGRVVKLEQRADYEDREEQLDNARKTEYR